MNLRNVVIALSLLANVGLAVMAVRLLTASDSGGEYSLGASTAAGAGVSTDSRPSDATKAPPASLLSGQTLWERLWSDDMQVLAGHLHEAGFSRRSAEFALRVILDERFQERKDALLQAGGKRLYWKSAYGKTRETVQALEQLEAEKARLIARTLGSEKWPTENRPTAVQIDRFGGLPPEKKSIVEKIEMDYLQLGQRAAKSPKESLMLELEKRNDLRKTLTPEELLEYDVRTSFAAELLRKYSGSLDLSESEFRTLVKIQQSQNDKVLQSSAKGATPLDRDEVEKKINAIDGDAVKSALGPKRFAEFEQVLDPESKMLNRVVKKLELPLSSAVAVAAARREATARAETIRFDSALTAEQRQSQLAALASETNARVTSALGDRGAGVYRKYDGKWLSELSNSTARPIRDAR